MRSRSVTNPTTRLSFHAITALILFVSIARAASNTEKLGLSTTIRSIRYQLKFCRRQLELLTNPFRGPVQHFLITRVLLRQERT